MPPQSQRWPADRALLFVHGIGNAKPGEYDALVSQVKTIRGDDAKRFAFYFLYYDQINDWFATKLQTAARVGALVSVIRSRLNTTSLANAVAAFAGDVIWPILVADARQAVRAAFLRQLQQIVLDGKTAGKEPPDQHLTIIAHSLGCFHVYESLHAAAADPGQGLAPATFGVRLDNLVFMASPVQLIRTVAGALGALVPQRETLFCVSRPLAIPSEPGDDGNPVLSARNTVSIAGNLDPVGGFFLRTRLPWAYTDLTGQQVFVDPEQVATAGGSEELSLAALFTSAVKQHVPPTITPENPHDWSAYVARHATDLHQWLLA
jgi:hypothetical protein